MRSEEIEEVREGEQHNYGVSRSVVGDFGTTRFMRFIENNHDLGKDQFADSLLGELSHWSGHPPGQGQMDDITLLTMDFKPY